MTAARLVCTNDKGKKQGKSRVWTDTEVKYFAIVLKDEKYEYGYKLDSLALKKSANKSVFEDVEKALVVWFFPRWILMLKNFASNSSG